MLLQTWLSPAFPVGGFAYSHGLESAVDAGEIADAKTLEDWVHDLVDHGSLNNDMALIACGWSAVQAKDLVALAGVNDLALALAPSRERHLETMAQGNAFLTAVGAAFPCADIEAFARVSAGHSAYPVALAVAASGHDVPLRLTCESWGLAFVSALVSAAVRLGPIGQTEGLRLVAKMLPRIVARAALAERSTLNDLGGAAIRSDIASMRHETQYSRLFRS